MLGSCIAGRVFCKTNACASLQNQSGRHNGGNELFPNRGDIDICNMSALVVDMEISPVIRPKMASGWARHHRRGSFFARHMRTGKGEKLGERDMARTDRQSSEVTTENILLQNEDRPPDEDHERWRWGHISQNRFARRNPRRHSQDTGLDSDATTIVGPGPSERNFLDVQPVWSIREAEIWIKIVMAIGLGALILVPEMVLGICSKAVEWMDDRRWRKMQEEEAEILEEWQRMLNFTQNHPNQLRDFDFWEF